MGNKDESKKQINWEYEHLRESDIIMWWFPKESICPIALYELGKWGDQEDKKIFVAVHEEYERKFDVEEQLKWSRPDVYGVYYSLEVLVDNIKKYLWAYGH